MSGLPYFDFLFERQKGGSVFLQAFKDHVHWGLFDDGVCDVCVGLEDYLKAAGRLSQKIISLSRLSEEMSVLDVGCGFGGTTRLIAQEASGIRVTGLNIDSRQIYRARSLTTNENVTFVEGDACALPFCNHEFDRLVALESTLHFKSRLKFLREAKRVLKHGGLLVLSDFVLHGPSVLPVAFKSLIQGDPMQRFYGRVNATTLLGYRFLSYLSGLKLLATEDVTERTLPTYSFLNQVAEANAQVGTYADLANKFMETISRKRQLRYMFLTFQAPTASPL